MMKKIVSILVAFVMVVSCGMISVGATEKESTTADEHQVIYQGNYGDNIQWNLDKATGNLKITGTGKFQVILDWKKEYGMDEASRVKYSYNGPWQLSNVKIKQIIFGKGITEVELGNSQFTTSGGNVISKVILADTVQKLSNKNGTTYFKEISLGKSFKGDIIEVQNPLLKKITISSKNMTYSVKKNVVFSKDGKKLVLYPIAKKGNIYKISSSVKTIGKNAFRNVHYIKKITGGKNITTISANAFQNSNVDGISFSKKLKKIGKRAFENCTNLSGTIKIPDTVKSIGKEAFFYTKIRKIFIGKGLKKGLEGFDFSSVKKINISSKNRFFKKTNGIVYSKNEKKLYRYPESRKNFKISKKVTEIGEASFYGSKIKAATIPKGVKKIGKRAFAHSNLKTVVIPVTITVIESGTFKDCYKLQKVTLPSKLKKIGTSAFSNSKISRIEIPKTVKTIGRNAFESTEIKHITIPENTKVKKYAVPITTEVTYEKLFENIKPTLLIWPSWNKITGAEGYEVEVVAKTKDKNTEYKAADTTLETKISNEIQKNASDENVYDIDDERTFRIRAYKTVDGQKVYTQWSDWSGDQID